MSEQLRPNIGRHRKAIRVAFFFAACLAAASNFITYKSPLSRFLTSTMIEEAQVFQLTITGVPDRVPTLAENMVLEAVLFDYLKEKLSPRGVGIYTVRVKGDKTIHYSRALNEQFTVIGEQYASNGNIELDQSTLDIIDNHNQRILGQSGEDESLHQISILILIKGSHHISSGVSDYDEMIVNAINLGHSDLTRAFSEPSTTYSNEAASYFKEVQSIVCIGVGPRDDEPYLEMKDNDAKIDSSTDSESEQNKEGVGRTSYNGSSESPNNLESNDLAISKMSKSDLQSMRMNDLEAKNTFTNKIGNDSSESFNADALQFRLVSSIFFIAICAVAGLWYVGKIAAKKHEERKQKMALAKKAYEGPRTEPNKALFNNGKFTGVMDTGAGL